MRSIFVLFLFFSVNVLGEVVHFRIDSEILGEEVTARVSLPDTYHHSESFSYPLLVILDGSTQFNHMASSVHFYSTYAVIPEMIVVGISTQDRLAYFTPTEPEAYAGRSGKADKLTKFLEDEFSGILSEKYRISPYSIISGHSLSGLYTSYLAINNESMFDAAISISPSLWWDDSSLIDDYKGSHASKENKPFRWFLSMANEPNEMPSAFNGMLQALNDMPRSGLYFSYARFPNETHDSTPLVGNAKGLQAVFSGWNAVPEIDVMSLSELKEFYSSKVDEYGYLFPLSVHQYNVYGLKAAYEGKTDWGIEILEQGAKEFPDSEILWDSLATAYKLGGKLKGAMSASDRAVKLAEETNSIFLSEINTQNAQLRATQVEGSLGDI
ncbi:alpha/beta hydrolase-fold protein [Microbulbifer sp. VAAF005]|uniref:alpha/beta hydrolase-fold protein n=1 Tax=Microbulbifer sp. VAAF005 TaxID=3034230 RepID=UPI0024AE4BBF|nr:alpha/beta hydrolase-fold protein [Microbulbifer sp. VAAF005]WHI47679.1 alpha/beta hydrolase-fold protein [Microbulbifer sp. VAAF005]